MCDCTNGLVEWLVVELLHRYQGMSHVQRRDLQRRGHGVVVPLPE